jgi:hypothetical protein
MACPYGAKGWSLKWDSWIINRVARPSMPAMGIDTYTQPQPGGGGNAHYDVTATQDYSGSDRADASSGALKHRARL